MAVNPQRAPLALALLDDELSGQIPALLPLVGPPSCRLAEAEKHWQESE